MVDRDALDHPPKVWSPPAVAVPCCVSSDCLTLVLEAGERESPGKEVKRKMKSLVLVVLFRNERLEWSLNGCFIKPQGAVLQMREVESQVKVTPHVRKLSSGNPSGWLFTCVAAVGWWWRSVSRLHSIIDGKAAEKWVWSRPGLRRHAEALIFFTFHVRLHDCCWCQCTLVWGFCGIYSKQSRQSHPHQTAFALFCSS